MVCLHYKFTKNIAILLFYNELYFVELTSFYLYVPGAKESWRGMTSRYGSQEDIVPTLANLTLASRPYLAAGQDLLADTLREPTFGVNVKHVIVSDEARRGEVERRVRAMEALKKLWYKRKFVGE